MPLITYREAIRHALAEELKRDPNVVVLGEEVAQFNGAYKVTEGLLEKFGPQRIVDTPISEAGFIGMGIGASMLGIRPVMELMFWSFYSVAFDQILNNAANVRYMSGGLINCPIVIRGPANGGTNVGATHSHTPENICANHPGVKVVCPATAYDAKGLIKASIRDNNPVIFFEHKYLYRRIKDEVPAEDYVVPIGKARIAREGHDLSIITYAAMVFTALEAAETLSKEGIDVEILDLRSLAPLDREAIAATVRKTNKVILLHEDTRTGGIAGELAAIINEEAFDHLDGPIVRITALDTPVPFSPPQEEYFLPKVSDVIREARNLRAY
jgi:pyruvate dehydrogenase E1 component beta subunit